MKWIQLQPIACEACGEKHVLFQIFFRTDGILGLAVRCNCGNTIERHIKWEDEILVAIREEEQEKEEMKKTAKGRKQLKTEKKPKGNA